MTVLELRTALAEYPDDMQVGHDADDCGRTSVANIDRITQERVAAPPNCGSDLLANWADPEKWEDIAYDCVVIW